MNLLHPSLPLAFLELSWDGCGTGSVFIRINANTDLGCQFVLLCTGERGPSYRNSHFFEVINKGRLGECIYGGDYQYDNGSGGEAIRTGKPKTEQFRRPGAGFLVGRWKDDARRAQFGITTKEWSMNMHEVVLGKVESGMSVVLAAVRKLHIRDVTVVDCGVVVEL